MISSLFNYYRQKTGENGEIIFERVKEEDITIQGKTIEEIIMILKSLEMERIYGMKMCTENMQAWYDILVKEQHDVFQRTINNMMKKGSDTLD